jgi:hypothetical protein
LDRGWPCIRTQYIEYSLMNGFVFPVLAIWSISWLLFVGLLALLFRRFWKERTDQSIAI